LEQVKNALKGTFRRKRLKKGLNAYTKGILTISGFIQLAFITNHINTITKVYENIVGFYMFIFVLTSIINILNGFNFSNKKSMITLVATILVTIVQTIAGYKYIDILLTEVSTRSQVVMNTEMIISISFIVFSALSSIIASIIGIIFITRKTEIDIYM